MRFVQTLTWLTIFAATALLPSLAVMADNLTPRSRRRPRQRLKRRK